MTNLPININTAPPAKSAVTASSHDESSHTPEQGFNNVLARQVNDAGKPAQPAQSAQTSTAKNNTAEDQNNTAATPVSDSSAVSPTSDMLATLLAQQNPAATPQQDNTTLQNQNPQAAQNPQLMLNPQLTPNPQIIPDPQVAAHLLAEKNIKLPQGAQNTRLPANSTTAMKNGNHGKTELILDTTLAKPEGKSKTGNALINTAKSADPKDLTATTNSHTLRGSFASELAASTQQTGFSANQISNIPTNPTTIATVISQQPAWGDEFSQKITWMATQQNQSAELHLNPPQLGPLDVTLKMNGDQATATFTSPHAAVREAIEQAMPKLREMLADNGIMLGNAMVSDQPARHNPDHEARRSPGRSNTASSGDISGLAGVQESRVTQASRHNGMVDTFA